MYAEDLYVKNGTYSPAHIIFIKKLDTGRLTLVLVWWFESFIPSHIYRFRTSLEVLLFATINA